MFNPKASSKIFDPICLIVSVDDVNEALTIISSRPSSTCSPRVRPQWISVRSYLRWWRQHSFRRYLGSVLQWIRSGQPILNETFQQVNIYEMPFGSCADAGCMLNPFCFELCLTVVCSVSETGTYLGKYSFDTFTHLRGSINVLMP